jgi:hypothetical protein
MKSDLDFAADSGKVQFLDARQVSRQSLFLADDNRRSAANFLRPRFSISSFFNLLERHSVSKITLSSVAGCIFCSAFFAHARNKNR